VVQPTIAEWGYVPPSGGEEVAEDFNYRSDNNDMWLSVEQLRSVLGITG
jgi:UDP-N-acetylglucosamine 4,6-dehydratase